MVVNAEAVEKIGILLAGDLGKVGHAVRVVILAVGLQESDNLGAAFVVGRRGTSHAIRKLPDGLICILELAGNDFFADPHIGEFPIVRIGAGAGEFHSGIGAEEDGRVGCGNGFFQLALPPVGETPVGLFAFSDILRTLQTDPVGNRVHHGAKAVRPELVDEGFQVLLTAREDLWIDRKHIAVLEPILPAPSVGVHIDALHIQFLCVVDQRIKVLRLLGADHEVGRVFRVLAPLLGPLLGAFVGPLALHFWVRDFFLGPNAEQSLVVLLVVLRNEQGETTKRVAVAALPEIGPCSLAVRTNGFKPAAREAHVVERDEFRFHPRLEIHHEIQGGFSVFRDILDFFEPEGNKTVSGIHGQSHTRLVPGGEDQLAVF